MRSERGRRKLPILLGCGPFLSPPGRRHRQSGHCQPQFPSQQSPPSRTLDLSRADIAPPGGLKAKVPRKYLVSFFNGHPVYRSPKQNYVTLRRAVTSAEGNCQIKTPCKHQNGANSHRTPQGRTLLVAQKRSTPITTEYITFILFLFRRPDS